LKGLKAGVLLKARYCTNWLTLRTVILLSQFDHLYAGKSLIPNGGHKSWLGLLMRDLQFFLATSLQIQNSPDLNYDPVTLGSSRLLFLLCEYIAQEQKDTRPLPVIHFF